MKTKHAGLETVLEQGRKQPKIPSTETLALLAAQARFAALSQNAAVSEAIHLWDEADALVMRREQAELGYQWLCEHKTPMPKQFPASLEDFFKLIVRGKTPSSSQTRFKDFLDDKLSKLYAEQRLTDFEVKGKSHDYYLRSKRTGFPDETSWLVYAGDYSRWWDAKTHAAKVRAGQARADKATLAAARNSESTLPVEAPRRKKSK
jgi:hypothetical protein